LTCRSGTTLCSTLTFAGNVKPVPLMDNLAVMLAGAAILNSA
jgi:hypothetical protein